MPRDAPRESRFPNLHATSPLRFFHQHAGRRPMVRTAPSSLTSRLPFDQYYFCLANYSEQLAVTDLIHHEGWSRRILKDFLANANDRFAVECLQHRIAEVGAAY